MFRTTQQVSEKQDGQGILSIEQHAGYAAANARMRELSARRARAEEDLATKKKELAGQATFDVDTEARAVVNGKGNDDSQKRLSGQIADLQKDVNIFRRACVMQSEVVSQQLGIASEEIVTRVKPEYLQLRRALFLTLVELGKRAEEACLWREKLSRTGADGMGLELSFADIIGHPRNVGGHAIGSPTEEGGSIIAANLREGLRRGDIRRDELPAHWKNIY